MPYNKDLILLARENRKNPTPAEQKIWREILSRKQLRNYKFIRQRPIDRFIVDFYCSKLRLVIEVDGDSHADKVEHDRERTQILEQKYKLRVFRYTNSEVLGNIQGVFDDIIEKLTPLAPLIRGK